MIENPELHLKTPALQQHKYQQSSIKSESNQAVEIASVQEITWVVCKTHLVVYKKTETEVDRWPKNTSNANCVTETAKPPWNLTSSSLSQPRRISFHNVWSRRLRCRRPWASSLCVCVCVPTTATTTVLLNLGVLKHTSASSHWDYLRKSRVHSSSIEFPLYVPCLYYVNTLSSSVVGGPRQPPLRSPLSYITKAPISVLWVAGRPDQRGSVFWKPLAFVGVYNLIATAAAGKYLLYIHNFPSLHTLTGDQHCAWGPDDAQLSSDFNE